MAAGQGDIPTVRNGDSPSGGTAERPPSGVPPESPSLPIGERPGDNIGPYRLLSVLGEGGFGVVFLAERRRPFVQRVALKVIKPGMDSRAVLARFEQERQALAVMDHPNVAQVLDGGVTPSGRPYFVMEHVAGEPITEYCDRQNLTIRERLELFIPVCEAVQHAHMKGIIHRDLKPSNILVTVKDGQPIPKVIDFGVAKAISHTLTERTVFTEQGALIGTPEYMSPEQAEMGATDIDTRADVYTLGVVLYELLSGALPFDSGQLRRAAYGEIQKFIRETEPPRPSTKVGTMLGQQGPPLPASEVARHRRLEPAMLVRLLEGDLDWIVMRCLEKDRTRRYEAATALARDIARYLADEPVEASPPSRVYTLRKFLRRNRSRVTIGIVFGVVAAALTAAALTAARNRRELHERAIEADQLKRLLELEEGRSDGYRESLADRTLRAQIATRKVTLDVDGVPLQRVIEDLARRGDILIRTDWVKLEEIGVARDAPVRMSLRDVSVQTALGALVGSLGRPPWQRAQFVVQDGGVTLSSEESLRRLTSQILYDVGDLLGADSSSRGERLYGLLEIIRNNVDFEGWRDNGGETGTITVHDSALLIVNTLDNHRQIAALLASIRRGGVRSESSKGDSAGAARLGPTENEQRTVARLQTRRCRLDYGGATLAAVLNDLGGAAGVQINVDWVGLDAGGVKPDTPVTLRVSGCPAAVALDLVLAQVGRGAGTELGYEVVEDGVFVTPSSLLDRFRRLGVYDVNDLLPDEEPARSEAQRRLLDTLQACTDYWSWRNNGGTGGDMVALDGRLIIRATTFMHASVMSILEALRATTPRPRSAAPSPDQRSRLHTIDPDDLAEAAAASLQCGARHLAHKYLAAVPVEARDWKWRHLHSLVDQSVGSLMLFGTYDGEPHWRLTSDHTLALEVGPGAAAVLRLADGTAMVFDLDARALVYDRGRVRLAREPAGELPAGAAWFAAWIGDWGAEAHIGICDASTATLLQMVRLGPEANLSDSFWLDFSPGSKFLTLWSPYTREPRNRLQVFDSRSGAKVSSLLAPDDTAWGDVLLTWSADSLLVAAHFAGHHLIHVWRVADGQRLGEIVPGVVIKGMLFSPDGERIGVLTSENRRLDIFEIATGNVLAEVRPASGRISCAAFAPSGASLVLGMDDGSLISWDLTQGRPSRVFVGHVGQVCTVGYSSDGRRLVSVGTDCRMRIWEPESAPGASRAEADFETWLASRREAASGVSPLQ